MIIFWLGGKLGKPSECTILLRRSMLLPVVVPAKRTRPLHWMLGGMSMEDKGRRSGNDERNLHNEREPFISVIKIIRRIGGVYFRRSPTHTISHYPSIILRGNLMHFFLVCGFGVLSFPAMPVMARRAGTGRGNLEHSKWQRSRKGGQREL